MEIYNKELRNIRITLIFLTIILLFNGGATEEVDGNYPDEQFVQEISSVSNMVELGNGYFGVLQGPSAYPSEQTIQIFSYDEETNSIHLHVQKDLMEFEELDGE